MKKTFRLLLSILLLVSISIPLLADTIRLKDGSVIRGQVIGFKDQQFTILIGGNARGRRGQTTVYVETSNRLSSTQLPVRQTPTKRQVRATTCRFLDRQLRLINLTTIR